VPRFTILQTFADRPDILALSEAMPKTLGRAAMKHEWQYAALDGTGVETTSASSHCVSKAGRKRPKYVTLMHAVLTTRVRPVVDVRVCEQRDQADDRERVAEPEGEHAVRRGRAEGGRLRRQGAGIPRLARGFWTEQVGSKHHPVESPEFSCSTMPRNHRW
jgi:hypothetical protein